MAYTVVFAPEAEDQLAELYLYIATEASPATAKRYTDAIVSCCETLSTFRIEERRATTFGPDCAPPTTKGAR